MAEDPHKLDYASLKKELSPHAGCLRELVAAAVAIGLLVGCLLYYYFFLVRK